jgi:hypothetical protein
LPFNISHSVEKDFIASQGVKYLYCGLRNNMTERWLVGRYKRIGNKHIALSTRRETGDSVLRRKVDTQTHTHTHQTERKMRGRKGTRGKAKENVHEKS